VARDSAKLRAYNQVLQQIQNRIKMTATLPGNPNYLLYTVPPFILGLPAIDLQDCIVYIVHQLRTGGFEVRFTYPNLLYISWKHYEQEYMREQNPITQAMKPAPANSSKKGMGGKRGMGLQLDPLRRLPLRKCQILAGHQHSQNLLRNINLPIRFWRASSDR